ncbi:MAG: glycosyltransferase family 2 protein [Flavobacteriaceae bacterium]|nr:glycosyltransferase family 2 protein [Flavobacteriaceae bacterium]
MQEVEELKPPLLSVIIPCYNDSEHIEQSINSALKQTYTNIEVIVVDDGSNIETKVVLKRIESRITKLITQENKGQSTARNVGINQAKGEYILVLDSDDYFEETFCEKAIDVFLNKKNAKIVTSLVNKMVDNKIVNIFKPSGGNIKKFIMHNGATGSCVFLKSEFERVNGYDETMKQGFEDWEFYIRMLKSSGEAYIIQEPLFFYRIRKNSTTSRANKVKYDLLKYIYFKNVDVFSDNFEVFISHLLSRIEREEMEKIKNTERLEFKIGRTILKPVRWVKSILR